MSFGANIRFEKITDASKLNNNDSVILVYEGGLVANGAADSKTEYAIDVTIPITITVTEPVATGVEPTSDSSHKGRAEKILRNGQLLIRHNDEVYTITGVRVKE